MIRPDQNQLYKYKEFNEYSISSLTDEVIWVSDPRTLNDPFEFTFHIESDLSYNVARRKNASITKANCLQKQDELIEKIKTEFITGGIFCLTESNNISLMWSHYRRKRLSITSAIMWTS